MNSEAVLGWLMKGRKKVEGRLSGNFGILLCISRRRSSPADMSIRCEGRTLTQIQWRRKATARNAKTKLNLLDNPTREERAPSRLEV